MTAAAGPRILVILPVHNRRATTALFIRSLRAQTYINWHLLLIDDGSTDGTADMVRAEVASLTVLRGTGDWWWGGALHKAYGWLRGQAEHHGDLVLIINDDTEFEPDFLDKAVQTMKPHTLMLGQLYDQAGAFVEAGIRWNWKKLDWIVIQPNQGGANCFSTRGLFLWARDFLEIGGFYPVLLPHYLSDYEFTMRAHRKGFALVTAPEVRLRYNEQLTGFRDLTALSVREYLKRALSIKSPNNPVYWTSFILLACPPRHVPRNLAVVWRNFADPLITRLWFYQLMRRVYRKARRVFSS